MKSELRDIITSSIKKVYKEVPIDNFVFSVDLTTNPEHGDFASNVAMQLNKLIRTNPKNVAENLAADLRQNEIIESVEIAGPGFLNFVLKENAFQKWLDYMLKTENPFKSEIGKGKRCMVEFVSANPTGPLHIGHGRGAAVGDSVARILAAVGYDVHKEYYVNDAGNQIQNLSGSILHRYFELYNEIYPMPEGGYKGDYIIDIANELKAVYSKKLLTMSEIEALSICQRVGVKTILKDIDNTLKRFNVEIDEYFSEQSLYSSGELEKCMSILKKLGATYEKDGAVWLSSEKLGDEKDRVLKKQDGSYTYLAPDIAYHNNKYARKFDMLVDVWGADHHGYVKRMESALKLLGHPENTFDVILVQMVGLIKGGEKITMSTRAGEFITLDWLIDEVSVDAARFFYNLRNADSQFEFDVDLAKTRSSDNPVYYVQYAHARVCSLLANAAEKKVSFKKGGHLELLKLQSEKNLIRKMSDFRYVIETAAQYNEPHRVAYYLQELASEFHSYYYNTLIVDGKHEMINARLNLCTAVAKTIKYGLGLLGVSAPDRM